MTPEQFIAALKQNPQMREAVIEWLRSHAIAETQGMVRANDEPNMRRAQGAVRRIELLIADL